MTYPSVTSLGHPEEELSQILEESLNEIFIFDTETLHFVEANRVARENLGYSLEALKDLTPLDLKQQFTRETFEELIAPLRSGSVRTVVFDTTHRRQDGSCYDVEVHLQLSTYRGKPAFVAIILDTTEGNRAREALLESEIRSRAILNTAVDAIITIDDRGRCELFNRAAAEMLGYSEQEVLGSNISMLMPPPYREEHDDYLANYLQTGIAKIIGIGREVVCQRKDGSTFPAYLSVSEVKLNNRRLFTGILQDISERKEAEYRLVQSERLAAIGEAMTSVAHESRNLLQKIQMGVENCRLEVQENEAVLLQIDRIERASDGLQALLDEVRSYAAPVQLEESEVSPASLWREAWQLLTPQRSKRNVSLREEIGDPTLRILVDRFRMVQVFRNMLENSLAACADPVSIVVSVSKTHTPEGGLATITLRDNGPGLSGEQKERIFEPFYTTKSKGTGLGMAIARKMVAAHGGSISPGTSPAGGAEFVIELPC